MTENETKFLVYCIEIYKTARKMSGKETVRLFAQYGILDYITKCYDALHTTGSRYIIEDISSLIAERKEQSLLEK